MRTALDWDPEGVTGVRRLWATPETIAKLVAHLPHVTALALREGLTHAHVEALIPLAEQGKLKKLVQLDLRNNPEITEPKRLIVLAQALQKSSPAFKRLMLAGTGIEKNGWNLLLDELPDLTLAR